MIHFRPVASRKDLTRQLIWFFAWVAVTLFAAGLHPSTLGHGTHTELGLPPCPSVLFFGRPCPGCGLTTSFTAFVHGDVLFALRAHPFGPFLYLALTVTGVGSLVCWFKKLEIDSATRSFSRASCAFAVVFVGFGIIRFCTSPHYADSDPARLVFASSTRK